MSALFTVPFTGDDVDRFCAALAPVKVIHTMPGDAALAAAPIECTHPHDVYSPGTLATDRDD